MGVCSLKFFDPFLPILHVLKWHFSETISAHYQKGRFLDPPTGRLFGQIFGKNPKINPKKTSPWGRFYLGGYGYLPARLPWEVAPQVATAFHSAAADGGRGATSTLPAHAAIPLGLSVCPSKALGQRAQAGGHGPSGASWGRSGLATPAAAGTATRTASAPRTAAASPRTGRGTGGGRRRG